MSLLVVDLNADVGEGMPGDTVLLEVITSANVACGFHAGDEETMRALCRLAHANGVAIGAHVGYRDRAGMGRRPLDVTAATVELETAEQIAILSRCAEAEDARVTYVKPHGALYHRAAADRACADAICAATSNNGGITALLGPPGSQLLASAEAAGLTAVAEGFADRGYLPDGSLVPRDRPGALRTEDDAAGQALLIALEGAAVAVDGRRIDVVARSICIHSDTPGAELVARRVADDLRSAGIELAPFA
jgi:UPF0271 protein